MLRPSIEPCWTDALVPLAARGVLPGLPPLSSLRHAVSDALPRSASNSASDGSALVFPASALLEAVEGCVESTAAIPAPARPAACLFIASLAMEQHVKAHSTKARLMRLPPINNSNVGGGRQPAAAGGLPPLRPYQADVVGMVAFSWGLALTSQLLLLPPAGGTGAATAAQAAAAATASERYSRLADDWEGNWLVMARTGSGKTRMFIEIARVMVESRNRERRPGNAPGLGWALVVVLVPQAILTTQHAEEFKAANLASTEVRAFSGAKKKLSPDTWRSVLMDTGRLTLTTNRGVLGGQQQRAAGGGGGGGGGRGNVAVVCTAESFANLLRQGEATMEQIDLLVLDEAHHCHKTHPYAKIMDDFYPKQPEPGAAAAAAPAAAAFNGGSGGANGGGGDDSSSACRRPRVLGVTASPVSELEMTLLDKEMSALLRRLGDARLYVVHEQQLLPASDTGGGPAVAGGSGAAAGVGGGGGGYSAAEPEQLEVHVQARPVDQWVMRTLQNFAVKTAEDRLGGDLRALQPHGQEAADDLYMLTGSLYKAVQGVKAAMANPKAKATTYLDTLGQWLALGRTFAQRHVCPALDGVCHLLDVLRKAVELVEDAGLEAGLPYLARKVTELVADEHGASEAGGCGDVSVRVSDLARQLLVEGGGELCLLPAGFGQTYVRCCFTSGQLQARTHPKFWALMEFLQRYDRTGGDGGSSSVCHGIVFVKTRQAVFHVSDMMRRTQQLAHVDVLELVGQNNAASSSSRAGGSLAAHHERHGRGMTDAQQQEVLRMFKDPSGARCKVLIATSAGEEGLDVPSCEFVVRYNAAATGIQLLQSRGRARKQQAAVFLAILQEATLDTHLHQKSRLEEATLKAYCQQYSEANLKRKAAAE
ncbi:hypothetical protein CHLRE_08g368300v5 [Chlamydomonas reinhardtii]|uniref:Uncharacterized protein n=1 Tax=Chlamydomonas reinhardtii TaxID=3055 RepID=A0A2K3DH19_CHLRE|nr:uncharacterized protein CHLRE_08g368300v5 [Chlamydomonas reinhardtii]PNW79828.1 hypothetical protein CHLRE_08g368300v5 [Chlamydomonas reinhardtii]